MQPVAQRAGHDREDDVVDGAAERVLDPFEGRQLRAGPGEAPVRADRLVQRHVGRRVGEGADDLADALQRLGHPPRGASRDGARPRPRARPASAAPPPRRWRRGRPARRCSAAAAAPSRPRPAPAPAPARGRRGRCRCRRPEMPSTIAWWVLVRIAKRSRSSPWTSHISQSGLERSSCWEKTRPARRISCSSPPGSGSAVWRMW